jgi:hypothetical protein
MFPKKLSVLNHRMGTPGVSRFVKYFAVAIVISACAGVAWYGDPFLVGLFAIFAFMICAAVLAVGVFLLFFSLATRRAWRPPLVLMAIAVISAGIVAGAISLNRAVQDRAVLHAKAYPDRIAPLLEAYRQAHGVYPKSLDQLPSTPPLPRLLRDDAYHSDGKTYSFQFPQPGGFIDTWTYDSETRTWYLET